MVTIIGGALQVPKFGVLIPTSQPLRLDTHNVVRLSAHFTFNQGSKEAPDMVHRDELVAELRAGECLNFHHNLAGPRAAVFMRGTKFDATGIRAAHDPVLGLIAFGSLK